MKRRERVGEEPPQGGAQSSAGGFNNPFRDLGKLVGPLRSAPSAPSRGGRETPPPGRKPGPPVAAIDEHALFQAAVSGVVPIPVEERKRSVEPPSRPATPVVSDEIA